MGFLLLDLTMIQSSCHSEAGFIGEESAFHGGQQIPRKGRASE
jgi:hypothetical protein